MPPVRFELTTPGLRDQCSTTELKRRDARLFLSMRVGLSEIVFYIKSLKTLQSSFFRTMNGNK